VAADHVAATSKPDALAPNLDDTVLLLGLLQAQRMTQDQRYADFVRQWLEAHKAATDPVEQLAVGSVILDLPGPAREGQAEFARQIGDRVRAQPTEGAMRQQLLWAAGFLGRLAQVTKDTQYSDAGLKLLTAGLAQTAPAASASQDLARDYFLVGQAAAAYPHEPPVTKAFVLASLQALRGMKETGGLWEDPVLSALNLAALNAGKRGAVLKEFRQLRGPGATPPPIVSSMTEQELRPLFPGRPRAPVAQLQRQLVTTLVERGKTQVAISQDLLKYGVDEAGAYGDSSPAAQGGFLLAYQKLDWRYGGSTWPGPR
jgi:hypothetical protein